MRRRWRYYFPLALLGAAYIYHYHYYSVLNLGWSGEEYWGGSLYKTFLMMLGVMADYLRLLVFPVRLSAWYVPPVPVSFWEVSVLISAGMVLALWVAALLFFFRFTALSFGLTWFLAALLPVSNLVPIAGSMMAERWLYIPSMGFCLCLGYLFEGMLKHHPGAEGRAFRYGLTASLLLLLSLYALRIAYRNPDWKDSYTLLTKTVQVLPRSYFIRSGLGGEYLKQGRLDLAKREYQLALKYGPFYNEALRGLGMVYYKEGNLSEAYRILLLALRVKTQDWQTHHTIGLIHFDRGEYGKAWHHFGEALRLNQYSPEVHNSLGELYHRQGRLEEAIAEYREALRLGEAAAPVYWNLAVALEERGEKAEAIRYWKGFLRLSKDEADRQQVANYLREMGAGSR